jgi:hypothetical protein
MDGSRERADKGASGQPQAGPPKAVALTMRQKGLAANAEDLLKAGLDGSATAIIMAKAMMCRHPLHWMCASG